MVLVPEICAQPVLVTPLTAPCGFSQQLTDCKVQAQHRLGPFSLPFCVPTRPASPPSLSINKIQPSSLQLCPNLICISVTGVSLSKVIIILEKLNCFAGGAPLQIHNRESRAHIREPSSVEAQAGQSGMTGSFCQVYSVISCSSSFHTLYK